jgi:hypothetical protein
MKALGTKLALQAALFLLLSSAAVPVRAQNLPPPANPVSDVDFEVCNKGTVPVEVVTATKNEPLLGLAGLYWDVVGTTVAPGKCEKVYGDTRLGAPAVYMAFGFADAKGQWGSGTIAQVPDFGIFYRWLQSRKIVTGAAHAICAQKDATGYRSNGDIPANCAGLKYRSDYTGHLIAPDARYGPLLPLTSALFFEPEFCSDNLRNTHCSLYLNISPSATDRELHAAVGTASGADDAKGDGGDSLVTQLLKAVAKDAAEKRQAEAQRQAQVAAAAPPNGFARFEDGCNAFYRDPANARLSMSDAPGWCACLSGQYRNLMTPEEEAKYANDFGRLFHGGIAQPLGFGLSKSDPAWPRLHPTVEQCQR